MGQPSSQMPIDSMKQARVPVLALALALTTPAWSMGYGDHVTSDRVTRDRYTDKYLTQPGAAEAIHPRRSPA